MDHETAIALEQSITHWEEIVKSPVGANIGPESCALCLKFNSLAFIHLRTEEDQKPCVGCPVYEKTGYSFCTDTPYEAFELSADCEDDEEVLRKLAIAELNFLKNLRD